MGSYGALPGLDSLAGQGRSSCPVLIAGSQELVPRQLTFALLMMDARRMTLRSLGSSQSSNSGSPVRLTTALATGLRGRQLTPLPRQ